MAKFIAIASYQGPLPTDYLDRPATGRAAAAVAGRLGTTPVIFPGGHDGFLGGEYGGMGKPEPFAATLRAVLDNA